MLPRELGQQPRPAPTSDVAASEEDGSERGNISDCTLFQFPTAAKTAHTILPRSMEAHRCLIGPPRV
jgi:hypothetical protein